jgi:hypothetical protein
MKNQILSNLFTSPEMADLLGKMNPDHLRDDLRQELFLVLCETDEEKIINLHNRGELRWYTARICLNMIASSSSPFHKKYRQFVKEIAEWGEYERFHHDESSLEFTNVEKFLFKNQHLCADLNEVEEREYHHTALVDAVSGLLGDLNDQKNYDNILFMEYHRAGSAGKLIKIMKEATGGHYIPKRTILQTVRNVKDRIKNDPVIKKLIA